MNNEELKKKIVEILEETEYEWTEQKNGYILQIFYDKLADALIAAGIGDVKEAEAEAYRYEMLYKLQNRDMALAERRAHDAEHRAARAERAVENLSYKRAKILLGDDSKEAMEKIKRAELRQAEKELEEEGKDD